MDKEKILTNQKIENCFILFDKDSDGKISAKELQEALAGKSSSSPESEQQWREIIAEIDKNKDGMIDLEEFKQLLFKKN